MPYNMRNNDIDFKQVSIVIPATNAGRYIGKCLDALVAQDYGKDNFQIIVVDGGSSDKTVTIVKRYGVQLLQYKGCTISTLRNIGVKQSSGEIIAFIDSDCIAPEDWLMNAVNLLQNEEVDIVGAEYALPENPSWTERAWALNINRRSKCNAKWLPSGNLIVKREVFEKIDGFREDLITSEDVDFCKRLRKAGYNIISDNRLSVIHLGNPKTIKDFFLKEVWRGKGAVQRLFDDMPKFRLTKSTSFAMIILLLIVSLLFGLLNGMVLDNWFIFFISLICIFVLPSFLAIIKVLRTHNWKHVFQLAYLYFIYGIARAVCLIDYRNWKLK
ncbi:MAG: glycosyltransferase [Candidatus Omnitrophica bacterium]|nr:glycosyltransferase [Candidatus Omnitrophota bacterium]